MTDRAHAFIVTLSDDLRIGDGDSGADLIANAIRCLRGVASVEPLVVDIETHTARMRVQTELRAKLWDALRD